MGGNITSKVGHIVCPRGSPSATLCHSVVISQILEMGSDLHAKIKRHNGFVLEKAIHQYVFFLGYKKYLKMKQNKVVKNLGMYFFLG